MALFSMSKKEFKRAIGGLYKKRLIEISDQGIRLKAEGQATSG
jgi:predicted RNA-binding protein (virulence factor B family)